MEFQSPPALRAEILTACKVLSYFRIVEGFGHVSVRLPNGNILMTPRRALGLVSEEALIELDAEGRQIAGTERPPLELPMHLAIYRRRDDVHAIARGHPRHVAAYACAIQPLWIAHGFGTNLGYVARVFDEPFLITSETLGEGVADALGDSLAAILRGNGMLAVGASIAHACVNAIFLEETASVQLAAQAASMKPQFYAPDEAERRNGDDCVHEPLRAWEYYVAVAEGRIALGQPM